MIRSCSLFELFAPRFKVWKIKLFSSSCLLLASFYWLYVIFSTSCESYAYSRSLNR